jgi:DNA (cytosine-5)-methyltransferase 1
MPQKRQNQIPIIDIFAGPGGLGEGFARYPYTKPASPRFHIHLSIEKESQAFETLRLRAFKTQFQPNRLPKQYYELLRQTNRPLNERLTELYSRFPAQAEKAKAETLCAELGNPDNQPEINNLIKGAIGDCRDWVLLGGPPCQAYSLVGRSRNRGNLNYRPEDDPRHFLYLEYLKIIAEHLPTVFVMENVKGLLSATVKNERIFDEIVRDLRNPRDRLGIVKRKPKGMKDTYSLFPLDRTACQPGNELSQFVVRMEQFGVPQARHRLIILGVRDDIDVSSMRIELKKQSPVSVNDVIDDLPRLRSGLSKEADIDRAWKTHIAAALNSKWYKSLDNGRASVRSAISKSINRMLHLNSNRGSDWVESSDCEETSDRVKSCDSNKILDGWYCDPKLGGVFNHESRGHIVSDLHRYLFAACFAEAMQISPSLKDFPEELLPNHKNAVMALNGSLFADRFRVQLRNRPSTTITSHISKDGHYYIHPDPDQCRSLTVREAARLQTFPDNYFFCGPRTSQYVQVGNAVPPYLAHQIAESVNTIFIANGRRNVD